jgi:hypothetical protein
MIRKHVATRALCLFLCAFILFEPLPIVVAAQESTPAPPESLDQARSLIKDGDYDGAIGVLRGTIQELKPNFPALREAYLLLIQSYVFLGNKNRYMPQGKETSALNYKAARELIVECLSIPQLRSTRPEPASEYPPEMITAFAEVRAQMFGSFRVVGLEPADAIVTFDADTLRPYVGDSTTAAGLSAVDIPVGNHVVGVSRPGFKMLHEEVAISPGGALERSYQLPRQRGKGFYAAVAGGAALVVAGVVALWPDNETAGAQPLPGPPGPPSKPARRR